MATTPAVMADGSDRLVHECDSVVNHYLKMDVSVKQTLSGDLPAKLTVRVGFSQLDLWSPTPAKPAGQPMQWLGDPSKTKALLEVGQKVGLALHYVPDDKVWSLMGELMFSVQSDASNDSVVHFQSGERNDCYQQPPKNLQDTSFGAFKQAVSACPADPSQAALARRENILAGWGTRSEDYKSAVCIPLDDG